MNYGWNGKGLTKRVTKKFLIRLRDELHLPIEYNEVGLDCYFTNDGSSPYLEQGEQTSYGGVRIRRITHLPEKEQQELIEKAEKILKEVIEEDKKETWQEMMSINQKISEHLSKPKK